MGCIVRSASGAYVGCLGGPGGRRWWRDFNVFTQYSNRIALICVLVCCGCPIWALVGSHLHQEVCVCVFLCVCVFVPWRLVCRSACAHQICAGASAKAHMQHTLVLVVRSAGLAGVHFEHVSGAQFWHASALSGRLAGGQSKRQERNLFPQLGRPPL